MLCLCGIMSPKKLQEFMEDGPGPRIMPPPSYDKARFCPTPQVPIHPLHRLNAELPEIPAGEESVVLGPVAAAEPETTAVASVG
jgi:hypothetical protein